MNQIKETESGFLFKVKVTAGASKNEIVGWENGALKIRINASPQKGKANQALTAFLAKKLHLAKLSIHILSGQTSRHKMIQIQDKSSATLKILTELSS